MAQEVLKEYKVLDDKKRQEYVQGIGRKIASVSDRQDLTYSFTVLDSEELNAFAIPGGSIYINRGLVDVLDEDEVAAVLSHEVAHVAARHAAKRIQSQMGYQLLMTIALYNVNKQDEKLAKTVAQGSASIFQLVLLGYSRQDELLADQLAIKYTHKAGYNPWGMVTSLKKLHEHSKEDDSWRVLAVFRSHPYLTDRIRAAEAEAGALVD